METMAIYNLVIQNDMKLDDNQMKCVNSNEPLVCVYGGAGTGKTYVVIAKALRLWAENPDRKIVIVTKLNVMQRSIQAKLRKIEDKYSVKLGIEVMKIDYLLNEVVTLNYGGYLYDNETVKDNSDEETLSAINWKETKSRILEKNGSIIIEQFDHILVDEAVDLKQGSFDFLEDKVKTDGSLTIMVDGFQNMDFTKVLPNFAAAGYKEYYLRRAYRTTDKIMNFAKEINRKVDNLVDAKYVDRRDISMPQIMSFINEKDELETLCSFVHAINDRKAEIDELCKSVRETKSRDIGIITATQDDARKIIDALNARNETVSDITETGIHVLTVNSAKGLEFDDVIIPFVENYKKMYTKLYIAITRSKANLYIYAYAKQRKLSYATLVDKYIK